VFAIHKKSQQRLSKRRYAIGQQPRQQQQHLAKDAMSLAASDSGSASG